MPKLIKTTGRIVLFLFALIILYLLAVLVHGTLSDYQPQAVQALKVEEQEAKSIIQDSTFSLLSWNLGYAGLGAKSDFFYHGSGFFLSTGRMIHSPQKLVDTYFQGISRLLKDHASDFYLLQEIDRNSSRSYFVDQYASLRAELPIGASVYASNFKVPRVPIPVLEPWRAYGKAESGLALFSQFAPHSAERHQLPGNYSWPKRIFQLDRCLQIARFAIANKEQQLVVINLHNSAHDKEGNLKKQQMAYLRDLVLKEYEAGNYVIAGGDWNQFPPYLKPEVFGHQRDELKEGINIAADFLPPDWQWIYDATVATIRSTEEVYQAGQTSIGLIDFFLISPNIKALQVKGIDHQFAFSDHQPVWMNVQLKGL